MLARSYSPTSRADACAPAGSAIRCVSLITCPGSHAEVG